MQLGSAESWMLDLGRISVVSKTRRQHACSCHTGIKTNISQTLRSKSIFHRSKHPVLIWNRFQAHVDRGDIVINANEWPAFLYNETMYNPKKEWVGLFLGETFVRVSRYNP